MTGIIPAITDTTCPHVRRLSELWCAGCLSPLGEGLYEVKAVPFRPIRGSIDEYLMTLLFHPRCVDGYACGDAIGQGDELIRGLK